MKKENNIMTTEQVTQSLEQISSKGLKKLMRHIIRVLPDSKRSSQSDLILAFAALIKIASEKGLLEKKDNKNVEGAIKANKEILDSIFGGLNLE